MIHLGCVRYLNTKPLIYGLEAEAGFCLHMDVPSKLLEGLEQKRLDVALLPVIDYQRMKGLRVVPAGGICCDGPVLTVRIFSRRPIGEIETLACDGDSHTSIALGRVILGERYGVRPRLSEWTGGEEESVLLIGDKVVLREPVGYRYQLDLGGAWKEMTGRPFVFATWMAREGVELGGVAERLERAKREGVAHVEEIVRRYAVPGGWPEELARTYLMENLSFDLGRAQLEAMEEFFRLAAKWGVVGEARNPKPE